jgi:hypothetical protein
MAKTVPIVWDVFPWMIRGQPDFLYPESLEMINFLMQLHETLTQSSVVDHDVEQDGDGQARYGIPRPQNMGNRICH